MTSFMEFMPISQKMMWSTHLCHSVTFIEIVNSHQDESKCTTAFSFIFGVNWLWLCGVTAYFGVCFHEIKCNAMTSFMELMQGYHPMWGWLHMILMAKVQRIHIAHLTNCSRLAKMIAIETQETKDNSVLRMTIRNPNAPTCEWAVQWTLRQKTP